MTIIAAVRIRPRVFASINSDGFKMQRCCQIFEHPPCILDQQSLVKVIQDCSAGSDVDSDDNLSEDGDIEPMSGIIIA